MNIFALYECELKCAKHMIDKHITKMPTESCQMLHTNIMYFQYVAKHGSEPTLKQLKHFHSVTGSELMKPAMLNHPSTIWARETPQNFLWLYRHAIALCDEYTVRYGKEHGTRKRIQQTPIEIIHDMERKFPSELTPVTIAMADEYRLDKYEYFTKNPNNTEWDFVIDSYRHYYLEAKWVFASWKVKERRPEWFPANLYVTRYNARVRAYNATNPKFPQRELPEEYE